MKKGASKKNGRVNVFVRTRPVLDETDDEIVVQQPADDPHIVSLATTRDQVRTFNFDQVFEPQSSQSEVYEKVARPIVSDVLTGTANGCVVAYGQTGTGKTHTMGLLSTSARFTPQLAGIIPRALFDIFHHIEAQRDSQWGVYISFVQIYMENVQDLLSPRSPDDAASDDATSHISMASSALTNLTIRESTNQGIYVEGLTRVEARSVGHALELVSLALERRVTAHTHSNAQSSRSHTCLFVDLVNARARGERPHVSRLTLVDLAGSERVGKGGARMIDPPSTKRGPPSNWKQAAAAAEKLRLEEAKSINQSLSALGNVISSIGTSNPHVPYRDSKLTRLLQACLTSQSCRMSVVATISPLARNSHETLSTLLFAHRCTSVQTYSIGLRAQDAKNSASPEALRALTAENQELTRQLDQTKQVCDRLQSQVAEYKELSEAMYTRFLESAQNGSPPPGMDQQDLSAIVSLVRTVYDSGSAIIEEHFQRKLARNQTLSEQRSVVQKRAAEMRQSGHGSEGYSETEEQAFEMVAKYVDELADNIQFDASSELAEAIGSTADGGQTTAAGVASPVEALGRQLRRNMDFLRAVLRVKDAYLDAMQQELAKAVHHRLNHDVDLKNWTEVLKQLLATNASLKEALESKDKSGGRGQGGSNAGPRDVVKFVEAVVTIQRKWREYKGHRGSSQTPSSARSAFRASIMKIVHPLLSRSRSPKAFDTSLTTSPPAGESSIPDVPSALTTEPALAPVSPTSLLTLPAAAMVLPQPQPQQTNANSDRLALLRSRIAPAGEEPVGFSPPIEKLNAGDGIENEQVDVAPRGRSMTRPDLPVPEKVREETQEEFINRLSKPRNTSAPPRQQHHQQQQLKPRGTLSVLDRLESKARQKLQGHQRSSSNDASGIESSAKVLFANGNGAKPTSPSKSRSKSPPLTRRDQLDRKELGQQHEAEGHSPPTLPSGTFPAFSPISDPSTAPPLHQPQVSATARKPWDPDPRHRTASAPSQQQSSPTNQKPVSPSSTSSNGASMERPPLPTSARVIGTNPVIDIQQRMAEERRKMFEIEQKQVGEEGQRSQSRPFSLDSAARFSGAGPLAPRSVPTTPFSRAPAGAEAPSPTPFAGIGASLNLFKPPLSAASPALRFSSSAPAGDIPAGSGSMSILARAKKQILVGQPQQPSPPLLPASSVLVNPPATASPTMAPSSARVSPPFAQPPRESELSSNSQFVGNLSTNVQQRQPPIFIQQPKVPTPPLPPAPDPNRPNSASTALRSRFFRGEASPGPSSGEGAVSLSTLLPSPIPRALPPPHPVEPAALAPPSRNDGTDDEEPQDPMSSFLSDDSDTGGFSQLDQFLNQLRTPSSE